MSRSVGSRGFDKWTKSHGPQSQIHNWQQEIFLEGLCLSNCLKTLRWTICSMGEAEWPVYCRAAVVSTTAMKHNCWAQQSKFLCSEDERRAGILYSLAATALRPNANCFVWLTTRQALWNTYIAVPFLKRRAHIILMGRPEEKISVGR
jgi:hypothetical protein